MPSRAVLATLAFAAVLLLPGVGRMGALDSTDARYLAIAREMSTVGAWWLPQLGGVPHLDKPPLAYWAAWLGFAALGTSELGGRAVQQLALAATALVVLRGARRLAPGTWSIAAPLAFLTMALPFGVSRGLATDVFQLALLTPALLFVHEGAERRSASRIAAAGALLGASMLAKGPIALLVAASIAGPWIACTRARLSLRGVAAGAALFAAIGLPWYAFVIHREPALLDWFVGEQLLSRATGGGAGHPKDALFLVRMWLAGLLPWTPVALLALWRLRPRGRVRDADAADLFLLAWALVPVALFSLFPTKLGAYVLPAFPAAALAIARAGHRGLLADRTARVALAIGFGTTLAVAAAGGAAVLGECALGLDLLPRLEIASGAAPLFFGAALLALAGAGGAIARRALACDASRGCIALAGMAGLLFACGYHAIARDIPTLRPEAEIAQRVPDARVIELSFKPSLFFYGDVDSVYVAGVRGLVEPWVDAAQARRLTLSRDDAVAMLREATPTFALVDRRAADALARATGARTVRSGRRYAFVANAAAQAALDTPHVAAE